MNSNFNSEPDPQSEARPNSSTDLDFTLSRRALLVGLGSVLTSGAVAATAAPEVYL